MLNYKRRKIITNDYARFNHEAISKISTSSYNALNFEDTVTKFN